MYESNLIQFAQHLIRTPSFTGQENELIKIVILEMNKLGYDRVWIDNAGNAIGEINGSHPGKSILLDAHADTVGVNPVDWTLDPFSGTILNKRIYGRGAADTKGNLAAMIYGAAKVDRSRLGGKIYVSATVNEEVMEGGSIQSVIAETKPDFVVIGEATELNLNRGGRGRAEIVFETTGKSAHSSSPEAGVCAVHKMMNLIAELDKRPLITHPFLGPDTMVLTDIISYPYPGSSVIPNRCRATYDRRLLLGEEPESLLQGLVALARINRIECQMYILDSTEETYTGHKLSGEKFFPAWLFSEDHPLVQNAITALRKTKLETQIGAFRFCTNAAYTAGIAGIPTIGYGLGKESDAHTVDESIALEELIMASEGYRDIIETVLKPSEI